MCTYYTYKRPKQYTLVRLRFVCVCMEHTSGALSVVPLCRDSIIVINVSPPYLSLSLSFSLFCCLCIRLRWAIGPPMSQTGNNSTGLSFRVGADTSYWLSLVSTEDPLGVLGASVNLCACKCVYPRSVICVGATTCLESARCGCMCWRVFVCTDELFVHSRIRVCM